MDRDNDGKLTADEYKYIYRVMDLDEDVQVSKEEVQTWITSKLEYLCDSKDLLKEDDELESVTV